MGTRSHDPDEADAKVDGPELVVGERGCRRGREPGRGRERGCRRGREPGRGRGRGCRRGRGRGSRRGRGRLRGGHVGGELGEEGLGAGFVDRREERRTGGEAPSRGAKLDAGGEPVVAHRGASRGEAQLAPHLVALGREHGRRSRRRARPEPTGACSGSSRRARGRPSSLRPTAPRDPRTGSRPTRWPTSARARDAARGAPTPRSPRASDPRPPREAPARAASTPPSRAPPTPSSSRRGPACAPGGCPGSSRGPRCTARSSRTDRSPRPARRRSRAGAGSGARRPRPRRSRPRGRAHARCRSARPSCGAICSSSVR